MNFLTFLEIMNVYDIQIQEEKFTFILKMFEMSLFFIITFISLVDAYKSRLISVILKIIPQDPQIKSITADIICKQKELSAISLVNEFAKHIKLQRRIIKLKDEKKELVKKQAFRVMKIRYSVMTAFYVIIFGSLITLMWFYRSESVAQVPAHWLWPVSSFFDWSNYVPGCITVPCWVAISSRATKTFAKHF